MPLIGPRRDGTHARSSRPDDLVSVAFDDAVLDRLAARSRRLSSRGHPRWTSDGSTDAIPELFAQWQDRLAGYPQPAPMGADRAAELVSSGRRRPSTSLRPALAVAAAICALLVGAAAIGARTARPGDPLFPVTQVLWSDQAQSAVAGQQVRSVIDAARTELAAGRAAPAAALLQQAARGLSRISDRQDHADVQRDLTSAWSLLAASHPRLAAAASADLTAAAGIASEPGAADQAAAGPPPVLPDAAAAIASTVAAATTSSSPLPSGSTAPGRSGTSAPLNANAASVAAEQSGGRVPVEPDGSVRAGSGPSAQPGDSAVAASAPNPGDPDSGPATSVVTAGSSTGSAAASSPAGLPAATTDAAPAPSSSRSAANPTTTAAADPSSAPPSSTAATSAALAPTAATRTTAAVTSTAPATPTTPAPRTTSTAPAPPAVSSTEVTPTTGPAPSSTASDDPTMSNQAMIGPPLATTTSGVTSTSQSSTSGSGAPSTTVTSGQG